MPSNHICMFSSADPIKRDVLLCSLTVYLPCVFVYVAAPLWRINNNNKNQTPPQPKAKRESASESERKRERESTFLGQGATIVVSSCLPRCWRKFKLLFGRVFFSLF